MSFVFTQEIIHLLLVKDMAQHPIIVCCMFCLDLKLVNSKDK